MDLCWQKKLQHSLVIIFAAFLKRIAPVVSSSSPLEMPHQFVLAIKFCINANLLHSISIHVISGVNRGKKPSVDVDFKSTTSFFLSFLISENNKKKNQMKLLMLLGIDNDL
jgi:predicted solute-binding protein